MARPTVTILAYLCDEVSSLTLVTPSTTPDCRICGAATEAAGSKYSEFSARSFDLARCPTCGFAFVVDPRTDYANIYDAEYYAGRGADPHVDYVDDVSRRGSVQEYEWRGIVSILDELGALRVGSRWLDFGCGLGGLLRHAREAGHDVTGFDEGFAADELRRAGLPCVTATELQEGHGSFDVVTAIEVVEHVVEPMKVFERMAGALRPGGLLFLTTGNARPHRDRLASWQYVRPEVHVSFYEPGTLERCLREVGLQPVTVGYRSGFTDIIRSKVLRTVGRSRRSVAERCVPWPVVSRLVDRRYGVTHQPIGAASARPTPRTR